MKNIISWFNNPPVNGPSTILYLRLLAGAIFFWEGVLKFVYTNQGIGRFTKLGFPYPVATANFIGGLEIIGGLFLLVGLFSRYTAFTFVIEMIVAMLTTKVALFLGTSPLPLPPVPPQVGIWAVLHEIRADYSLFLTCLFILIEGPGKNSLDRYLKPSGEL